MAAHIFARLAATEISRDFSAIYINSSREDLGAPFFSTRYTSSEAYLPLESIVKQETLPCRQERM